MTGFYRCSRCFKFHIDPNLYEQKELLKKYKDKLGIQKEKNKIFNSEFFVRELEKLYLSIMD